MNFLVQSHANFFDFILGHGYVIDDLRHYPAAGDVVVDGALQGADPAFDDSVSIGMRTGPWIGSEKGL